jgi:hypothetical protein
MDRGMEFMAEVKRTLRQDYGAHIKLITTRNPQANAVVERSHQTVKNMIKSQTITSQDDLENGKWTGVLSAVRFAMRATLHTTMRAMPMQLVYGRNAIHNIRFKALHKSKGGNNLYAETTNVRMRNPLHTRNYRAIAS